MEQKKPRTALEAELYRRGFMPSKIVELSGLSENIIDAIISGHLKPDLSQKILISAAFDEMENDFESVNSHLFPPEPRKKSIRAGAGGQE